MQAAFAVVGCDIFSQSHMEPTNFAPLMGPVLINEPLVNFFFFILTPLLASFLLIRNLERLISTPPIKPVSFMGQQYLARDLLTSNTITYQQNL